MTEVRWLACELWLEVWLEACTVVRMSRGCVVRNPGDSVRVARGETVVVTHFRTADISSGDGNCQLQVKKKACDRRQFRRSLGRGGEVLASVRVQTTKGVLEYFFLRRRFGAVYLKVFAAPAGRGAAGLADGLTDAEGMPPCSSRVAHEAAALSSPC